MRVHIYSNVIRIVFNCFFVIAIASLIAYAAIDCILNSMDRLLVYVFMLVLILAAKALVECYIVLLNRCGKKTIDFDNQYILHNNEKYSLYNVSFKYFKFQLSFLQTDLVIPKLVISIPDCKNIICYITRKQLNVLISKMKYDITMI